MLDLLLLIALAVVALVIGADGRVVTLAGIPIGLRSVENPLAWASLLALVRIAALPGEAVFGLGRRGSRSPLVEAKATPLGERLQSMSTRLAWRWAAALALAAMLVKLPFAWVDRGFYSGDDVEIHEMTLALLWGRDWTAWDLRSPVFPIGVILPIQAVAQYLGVSTIHGLVFAGRAVVCVISTAAVPMIVRTVGAARPVAVALVAAALFASSKLSMGFGASELPRPVATVIVLSAYGLMRYRERSIATTAVVGVLIALAAVLRFSEPVFLVPAVVVLSREGRVRQACILVAAFLVAFAAVACVADLLYWGSPFHSVARAIEYTLVEGRSSRGFQPPWYYLVYFSRWTNWIVLALAVLAMVRRLDDPRR